tara:strand:+ start:2787 stop:4226 length:1440 start_codon:yes stop_codon:yes gene_type:complete
MRKNYERKGDFEFDALYAVRGDSSFNLLQFVNTLNIYEGVDQKFLSGSLTFTDANNVLRFYDFTNDVYIVGAFRTPLPDTTKNNIGGFFSTQDIETRSVFVLKVSDVSRTKMPTQQGDFVELKLMSPSAYFDKNKNISRSVSGVGFEPVIDMMEEFYFDRANPERFGLPNFLDESTFDTGGIRTLDLFDSRYTFLRVSENSQSATPLRYTFPFQRPSQMIGSMLNDMISTSNQFGYYMWETLTGFKSASIQGMHESTPIIGYSKKYAEVRFEEPVDERLGSIYTIDTMDFPTAGNRFNQTQNGAFSSKMYEFDITLKKLDRRYFFYDAQYPFADRVDRFPLQVSNEGQNEFSGYGNIESFDVSSFSYNTPSGEPDPNLYVDDEGHLSMISQKTLMYDTQLEITVPGNHIIEAGMTVNVDVPPNTISDDVVDEVISGEYLINALSHNFEFQGNTHMMSLGLTRNFRTTPKTAVTYSNLER